MSIGAYAGKRVAIVLCISIDRYLVDRLLLKNEIQWWSQEGRKEGEEAWPYSLDDLARAGEKMVREREGQNHKVRG